MAQGRWTADDLPALDGRTMLITGANSGIGYEAALQLARRGARVVLACRDQAKGRAALEQIRRLHPAADLALVELDLASLAAIRTCAEAVRRAYPRLDGLINNAGVMAIPYRRTADGFEMQFGTNHLGHFAFTGLVLDCLRDTPGARIVTVSSNAHRMFASIHWDDLQWEHRYRKWLAYGQTKLANLLFAYELQRRLAAAPAQAISLACHPGYAATNLQAAGPRMQGSSFGEAVMEFANRLLAQDAAMGALPTLYAATAPDLRGGEYIGPDGPFENRGYPKKTESNARSHDREAQRRLWEISEQLTGVHYAL